MWPKTVLWAALAAFLGGCAGMATGPVLGFSNAGPVLGWEGSMGAGPLLLSGGGAVRPRARGAVTSGYASAGGAIGGPVRGDDVWLAGTGSIGVHGNGAAEGPRVYNDAFVVTPWLVDHGRPCERYAQVTASVGVGVRFFHGAKDGALLWEIVATPKLGVLSSCPFADARSSLRGLSP